MEQMKMPTIEQRDKKKETEQKNPFEILTSELSGKTRDELTLEQRETEDAFREKEFRDLMQLINDDKVLVHKSFSLKSVLENGILSRIRGMVKRKNKYSHPADRWQDSAEIFSDKKVAEFLVAYAKYKDGKISKEDFTQYKEKTINEFPELGKARVRYYLEDVLPNGFDKGLFDASRVDGAMGFLNEFFPSGTVITLSYAKSALKAFKKVGLLGNDTISTTNTNILKKEWVASIVNNTENSLKIGSGWYDGHSFMFERPQENQLMALDPDARKNSDGYDKKYDKEENIHDTGVASKVGMNKIQSVSLDNCLYNASQRTLFLMKNYTVEDPADERQQAWGGQYVDEETLELLKKKQHSGITLFDKTLQALPIIGSISVTKVSFGNDDKPKEIKDLQESNEHQIKEKIKNLIKENHWDWYEKYGKNE